MLWLPVPINPAYKVSVNGEVKNHRTGTYLKLTLNEHGYHRAAIPNGTKTSKSGKKYSSKKHYYVHRLVYEVFIRPIPEGMHIHHIDNNPKNNHLNNLRLVTQTENQRAKPSGIPDLATAQEIRSDYAEGFSSVRELAVYHNVSETAIRKIINYKTWRP